MRRAEGTGAGEIAMSAAPRLHVEVEGSGPTVVLAHGFGGSARNFLSQARALRDRYRIVRFDARGHARSEAPAEASAYTPEAFVADLGRVLDQVGAPAAVVGGLSMGAGTALRFALAHPERVQGLVLAAFPPGADAPGTFAAVAADFAHAIEREGLEAAGARFVWGPSSGLDP
ncbi:MAG TPA: alpha/beta fold hydrolase, partial [Verrucomicrobiae bacterium]|nr:alpha/beta fold hydrolase [Verrucomicrobiae bacterium]